jgi:protoheme ferro-lyase
VARQIAPKIRIEIQPPYFDAPVASAKNHLESGYDHLLFRFHGIPERHLNESGPTDCHCPTKENCVKFRVRHTRHVIARNVSKPSWHLWRR